MTNASPSIDPSKACRGQRRDGHLRTGHGGLGRQLRDREGGLPETRVGLADLEPDVEGHRVEVLHRDQASGGHGDRAPCVVVTEVPADHRRQRAGRLRRQLDVEREIVQVEDAGIEVEDPDHATLELRRSGEHDVEVVLPRFGVRGIGQFEPQAVQRRLLPIGVDPCEIERVDRERSNGEDVAGLGRPAVLAGSPPVVAVAVRRDQVGPADELAIRPGLQPHRRLHEPDRLDDDGLPGLRDFTEFHVQPLCGEDRHIGAGVVGDERDAVEANRPRRLVPERLEPKCGLEEICRDGFELRLRPAFRGGAGAADQTGALRRRPG